ncbi:uncharacterized protein JN550_008230 [Neoarthrinium moseri]|uniref:uncharacterized protein n=1 Tax=Neoarthrinium moseri TaxID=1658444 RepID=UPI001FDCD02B|nr:uncharacterized protein JN550_008230 [Neoarthrinium moseri]KAI1865473.1 hypothetical protein JN550_008230 [Neoarthrinium moseri]
MDSMDGEPPPILDDRIFPYTDLPMLENGEFSDVMVKCDNRSWDLHKIILCTRSQWFRKAFSGRFHEAETSKVEITDFEPEQVERLLYYLYVGSIKRPAAPLNRFLSYVNDFIMGDYFVIPKLCKAAVGKINRELDVATVILQWAMTEPTGGEGEEKQFDCVPSLLETIATALSKAYTCGSMASGDSIRKCFVYFFTRTSLYHLNRGNQSPIMDAFKSLPEFARDCLVAYEPLGVDLLNVYS